jgi:hypothetical protein
MKNYEVYAKDPRQYDLLNNGVSKVGEIGADQEQLKTLRFELETFVCDGEYAKGLERIERLPRRFKQTGTAGGLGQRFFWQR